MVVIHVKLPTLFGGKMKQTLINCTFLCITLLFVFVFCVQKNKIENIRTELNRVEKEVVEYEQKTQRLLDMNFTLLSNGGWESYKE